jgi:hypothetical protein
MPKRRNGACSLMPDRVIAGVFATSANARTADDVKNSVAQQMRGAGYLENRSEPVTKVTAIFV